MATIQNLTVDQDADFTETLTIKDSTGTVVDISGQTVTSKLRKTHLSTSATAFTTAIVSGTDWYLFNHIDRHSNGCSDRR